MCTFLSLLPLPVFTIFFYALGITAVPIESKAMLNPKFWEVYKVSYMYMGNVKIVDFILLSFDLSLMRLQNNTKSNLEGNKRKRNQTKRRPVFVNKVYMCYGNVKKKVKKEKIIKASFHKLVFHTAVVH